jgi:hypothetical protein
MDDGRETEADAAPTAKDNHHLLLLSKQNAGACPEEVAQHSERVGVL